MTLIALPALSDHTIWMQHDGRQAIVDPADAAPVQPAPDSDGLALPAILVMHRRRQGVTHHAGLRNTQMKRPGGRDARRRRNPAPEFAQAAVALLDETNARPLQLCTPAALRSRIPVGPRNSCGRPALHNAHLPLSSRGSTFFSTIPRERAVPPFPVCTVSGVVHAVPREGAANHSAPARSGALREWKNQIR